ncbi:oxidoreductase [Trametes versicolor FP-101664 SS1]|uniref:oxidoreductase n=1 Tax=Trametes versicolor (strain FP-101664) TaxID=717944 RepID=UPI000462148A|nr:oxidoreductase [Trametes versicolor FP-101664 SS1]EIW65337.1 oxidoreductase [Trametes versicolor FP-101664 SS1]
MSASLSPKVVLVTGCSSGGIGFSLCEEYAAQGCKVYATARRLEAMGGFTHNTVERLVLDVMSDDNVQDVVRTILEKEGRIDVLVNNAGVLCTGPTIDVPMDEIQRAYDANVFSIIRMCRAVIPHMASRKSGTVVNISSVQAYVPTPWAGIYASTKAAMHSLSEVLYMECTPLNIAVVLVTTGAVRSNLANNRLATYPGLPEGSLYARYLPNIIERVGMSQGTDSMPTDEYARRVVRSTLQGRPPRQMRLGGKTLLYRVLQWLPRGFVLWLMWRRFSRATK